MSLEPRGLFLLLIAAVAVARLAELRLAKRNVERLQKRGAKRGAVEVGASHYPWMVALHTGFLVAAPSEVYFLERPFLPTVGAIALVLFVAGMAMRYWVIRTLGERWTTRVFLLPGEPLVSSGPYRFFRHPNYIAVAVEILALPLVHTAWLTAIVFSALNAWLLRVRVTIEDDGLRRTDPERGSGERRAIRGDREACVDAARDRDARAIFCASGGRPWPRLAPENDARGRDRESLSNLSGSGGRGRDRDSRGSCLYRPSEDSRGTA